MSNKLRYCILCKRYDGRSKRASYTRIYTVEREAKLREGYRRQYNGQELDQPLLNQLVHQKCYNKIVQFVPSVDETISSNPISISVEQHQDDDNDEEHDQVRDCKPYLEQSYNYQQMIILDKKKMFLYLV
jgi:hypothetical protein